MSCFSPRKCFFVDKLRCKPGADELNAGVNWPFLSHKRKYFSFYHENIHGVGFLVDKFRCRLMDSLGFFYISGRYSLVGVSYCRNIAVEEDKG